ncbi:hypothetical protein [Devosia sp.]|uniref:hypothetical protein n=1 Tax=Devosia sp. TaxID=1871048 RepID=UPI001A0C6A7C|nr:hypothetical protein [Devosia sp.]MBE0578750.1 hypothetical protein [Devosia sp.]
MPVLTPDLLFAHADSPKFHATTKAHGLYSTFEFVLRLSPRVHSAIAGLTPGITTGVSFEQLQAMSTYVHETVHWWQHIGSTYGFILGLNYPVQTHCVVGNLKKLVVKAGFKKSVLQHSALLNALGPKGVDTPAGISNIIVNNHFDLEVFRAYTLGPRWVEPIVQQPLFEAVGHALNMTYGQTLYVLGTTVDPTFSAVPNPDQWQEGFRKLRADKAPGYHYEQSVELWEIGAEEIFEGQARFIQIQYLFQASGKAAQWKDFADLGMLDGVYVRAFQSFLNGTESEWPDRIDDPLVGLFLLICDMAINPGSGFPFPVQPFFESFITDVNPGSRFMMLCRIVSLKHPDLKRAIKEYTREEYEAVTTILSKAMVDRPPLESAQLFSQWFAPTGPLSSLRRQYDTYQFQPMNYVIGHLFAHFLAFQEAKFAHPEFFCWAGMWMAGDQVSQIQADLFEKHGAIFVDKEEDDGVFPRLRRDHAESVVHSTYQKFYDNTVGYDLVGQWIRQPGPFKYDLSWLSANATRADMERYMREGFQSAFGLDPADAEILPSSS